MEFFLEIVLTAVVALVFSFVVAKLISADVAGSGGGGGGGKNSASEMEEKSGSSVGEETVTEKLQFGGRMDAPMFESERSIRVAEERVENVDRFGGEPVRVDEFEEAAKGSGEIDAEPEKLPVQPAEAESSENVISEAMVARGEEKQSKPVEERSDPQESGDVAVAKSEDVRVEEIELKAGNEEKTEELDIEEDDDDWEGIERSELEKAFAAAANFVEESGEAIGIGTETKMELYGLHKVATEGSCREPQPMALMVSARAKWNAWQKLGKMSQEEAMERYLAIVSKEIPGWMQENSAGEKKPPEIETSVVILPLGSGSLRPLPPVTTRDSNSATEEGDMNGASNSDSKGKVDSAV